MGRLFSITPRPRFTPGEKTPVPIGQEAGWSSELVWTQRLEEKSFAYAGDRTPNYLIGKENIFFYFLDKVTHINFSLAKCSPNAAALYLLRA
jgi:hypothetical protein